MKNFRQILEEASNNNVTSMKRTDYSWGILRVMEIGSSFSIVIHPDGWDIIDQVITDNKERSFEDETGQKWMVSRTGQLLSFKGINGSLKNQVVNVLLKDFVKKFDD